MSKPRKDQPLKMPRYRGGQEALHKFITENLKYPQEALDHKIEGSVEVGYDVDGLGRVRNIRILSSLGYGCDEEVIRLIESLMYEKANNPGRNVTAHKKLKIDFKLPKPKPQGTKVQYHYVQKAKPKLATKAQQPTTTKSQRKYTISVKVNK